MRPDELIAALLAAAEELRTVHGWTVDDGDGGEAPEDGVFVTVLTKHVGPLLGDGLRHLRIAALKAELQALEQSNG